MLENEQTDLIEIEDKHHPNFETYLVADMVETLQIQSVNLAKELVGKNHGHILDAFVRQCVKRINWNFIQQKYNLSE